MRKILLVAFMLAASAAQAQQLKDPLPQQGGAQASPFVMAPPPGNGTTRLYNDRGVFVGRAEERPNGARFYDNQGRFTGRAETRPGGVMRYYDAQGRFTGQSRTR